MQRMRNPERAISTLTGEVHALFMFAQVLAKTHHSPSLLRSELEEAAQMGLARLEPEPVQDAVITGFQDAIAGIRRALEANPQYNRNPQP